MAIGVALALAACGNDTNTSATSTSTAHGTLVSNPPFRIASVNAATLAANLGLTSAGAQLLQIAGSPICGVDFYHIVFWTTGAAGEMTQSSGALMVPTGPSGTCSGPRPIVEYAHGTQTNKAANIADITDTSNTEGALIAAMFAAQGYIVVAPNYAGYDISTLAYTPYTVAAQNAAEMMDMLAAARTALPNTFASSTRDNGTLFLTGYSQGAYVAMATLRAMEAANMKVTAFAGGSGPYALEAFVDSIVFGDVALGATEFAPLLANSYQHAYGNIDSTTVPVFSPTYTNAQTLLPSTTPIDTLFAENLLPQTAVWNSTTPVVDIPGQPALSAELTAALAIPDPMNPANAVFDLGFGNPSLLTNTLRVAYAEDAATNPDGAVPTPTAGVPIAKTKPTLGLRQDAWLNDMRNGAWGPIVPSLLCGGDQDPTVFFSVNTLTMQAFWSGTPYAKAVTVLDVNGSPSGPFAAIQTGFQASEAAMLAYLQTPAGGGLSASAAQAKVVENYHVDVAPFCVLAARSFFGSL